MSDNAETEVAWTDIAAHERVIASDQEHVGKVVEVAALPEEDIFHGVVFEHHTLGTYHLAEAGDIDRITDVAVYLNVDSIAAQKLPEFHEMHIKTLGVRGFFKWKHLGWSTASE